VNRPRFVLLVVLLGVACVPVSRAAEELVGIPTRPGVTQSYLLLHGDAKPSAIVLSFVGGPGAIGLSKRAAQGPMRFGPGANFLIRIRNELADNGLADAILDAPSDRLPDGMSDDFRLGRDHLTDVRAVIADIKARFPQARIFLLGTSRGSISVASLARDLGNDIDGAILSSTVTQPDRMGEGLSRFDFSRIKVPLLVVHHKDDGCRSSPYDAARSLGRDHPLVSVSGGSPPQTGPCEPLSPHGFFGRESDVAGAMRNWMLGRRVAREL
jgi:pimeloyl-ACP methyl ester carboxylesterase